MINDICDISIERMIFNNYTKEESNKMAKHSVINITYYEGYILKFYKVNAHATTPHKLIFSKNRNYLKNKSNINVKSNNK